MALVDATLPLIGTPGLPPGPPYPCAALRDWVGQDWSMPPGDPRLRALDRGAPEPIPALALLAGNRAAWLGNPEYMDFLDDTSPVHPLKRVERELYEHWWGAELRPGLRVLDLGGGIGRFTQPCLDRGCDVELVDPDLRSLRCALDHAAGRPGRLDLHWTTGECLPDLAPVDLAILCEVLNYVEDPALVLRNVRRVLKPGGALLLSVEARWGWALSTDVPPDTLPAFFDGGPVHVAGDRWVRLYDRPDLEALLAGWTIEALVPTHYVVSGPFEVAAGALATVDVLAAEARLRVHPIAGPLNRAWTVIAR